MSTYNASNLINSCVNKGLTFSQVCRYEFLFVFVGFVQVLMKLSKIVNVIDLGIHCSLLNIVCETQTYLDNNLGGWRNGLLLSIMFKLWKGLKKDREEKRLGKPKITSLEIYFKDMHMSIS